MGKITTFTDLNTWKEAYKLVILIYKYTDQFPSKEIYALVSQMRRSAVSVCSNIAEGFSRRTKKEKSQFYSISSGSLTELQNQIIISRGVGYIDKKDESILLEQTVVVQKLIKGLVRGLEKIHNT